MSVIWSKAQNTAQWETESQPTIGKIYNIKDGKIDTGSWRLNQIAHTSFEVLATDTVDEIFSFRMTGDTNRLKPIDTNYYTMANIMYREVFYRYFLLGDAMLLTVRSYNDNHRWLFFGMQLTPYKHDKIK